MTLNPMRPAPSNFMARLLGLSFGAMAALFFAHVSYTAATAHIAAQLDQIQGNK